MTAIPATRIPIETLRVLVHELTGLETIWSFEEMPFIGGDAEGPNAYAEISITSYVSKGIDEYRQAFDEDANVLTSQIYGYRVLTLSTVVRSFDVTVHPADLCERLRFRLRTVSARKLFTSRGLALVDIGAVSVFNQTLDAGGPDLATRVVVCGSIDVRLAMAVTGDPQDDDGITIETVNSATGGVIPGDLT